MDQMLREMTAEQFMEWQVFATLEPFDEERQDQRMGSVVQMLANIHRGKNQSRFSLRDSTLRFGDATRVQQVQDWRAMKLIAQTMTAQSRKRGN